MRFAIILLALGLWAGPALAWPTTIDKTYPSIGHGVAIDAAGNVVTAGGIRSGGAQSDLAVVKLDATGAELWRFVLGGDLDEADAAGAPGIDAAGDIVVGARLQDAGSATSVLKIDGATGSLLWRTDLPGPNGAAAALDAAGDVLAVASETAFKLDGSTGAVLWTQGACTPNGRPKVDGAGDVVLLDNVFDSSVCKLDGSTGAVEWDVDLAFALRSVALDAVGDVAVVGSAGLTTFEVTKLDGTTGALLWSQPVPGDFSVTGAESVVFDGAGDVVAGGTLTLAGSGATVFKFDGTLGTELWRGHTGKTVFELDVDALGNVFASRYLSFLSTSAELVALRGTDGARLWSSVGGGRGTVVDAFGAAISLPLTEAGWEVVRTGGPLAGRVLTVVDTPGGTKLVLKVKDEAILYPGVAPADPFNPAVSGATLTLANPGTAESDTLALPAAGWVKVTDKVMKYLDKTKALGPCVKAKVSRKGLKVVCKGIGFTLDEPSQGTLTATLEVGGEPRTRQCAEFGGTVKADVPGFFKATKAPSPFACP